MPHRPDYRAAPCGAGRRCATCAHLIPPASAGSHSRCRRHGTANLRKVCADWRGRTDGLLTASLDERAERHARLCVLVPRDMVADLISAAPIAGLRQKALHGALSALPYTQATRAQLDDMFPRRLPCDWRSRESFDAEWAGRPGAGKGGAAK